MLKKLLVLLVLSVTVIAQTKYPDLNKLIGEGEFSKAAKQIDILLSGEDLDAIVKYDLEFQKERMERIRKDFRKSAEKVLDYIKRYYPDADEQDLKKWEEDGTLEYKIIDGKKLYFNRSAANLFRVNKEAKQRKIEVEGGITDKLDEFLEGYLPGVVDKADASGEVLVDPVKMKLKYKLVVDADAVPAGEMIRAWLPYPREGHSRQHSISFIGANADEYVIADNVNQQRTIYMQKQAESGKKTEFSYELEYTAVNEWQKIDPEMIQPYDKASTLYKVYTDERAPHIVFTDRIKELSEEIVGDETNPVLQAKKIFEWISNNIPWAGAREYSTIQNISEYCLSNGWGDCGIKTLSFMTLCRYNGIPTKWQSGWMLHPTGANLHDWCEIYFEGYGWLPVDQSFGLVDSDDEDVKWFFFGGMDAFRFIVNDDYSCPLFPAKIFPRSETVDFQRGEVEWRGGNLYYDKWDYFMDVKYLNQNF